MIGDADLRKLAEHYDSLFRSYGDSPKSGQWSDRESQEARLAALCAIGDLSHAKVLDFGCGTAHLLSYLRGRGFEGEYVGYDIAPTIVEANRAKFPAVRFELRNVLTDGVGEPFDYVIVSGVFNNRMADNWAFQTSILSTLFRQTRVGLAFNNLSTYVDYLDKDLSYVAPEKVFRFCKERLSPMVAIRHDYQIRPDVIPFEFTTYVFASDLRCRPSQAERSW